MSRRGPFNLNWPWRYLRGEQMPGDYSVPNSVNPTLDIGSGPWPRSYLLHTDAAASIIGITSFVLPPPIEGRVRAWYLVTFETNNGGSTLSLRLRYFPRGGTNINPFELVATPGIQSIVSATQVPMIGEGWNYSAAGGIHLQTVRGARAPWLQYSTDILEIRQNDAAAANNLQIRGLFLDLDENQPVPGF